MPDLPSAGRLPDAQARLTALTDHERTLLVEAGAGSGKTSLLAGRVALLIAAGVHPKEIVAITFTEAAASELLDRIESFFDEPPRQHHVATKVLFVVSELRQVIFVFFYDTPSGVSMVEMMPSPSRSISSSTSIWIVAITPSLVAVMNTVPLDWARTKPSEETVAIAEFEER